MGKHYSKGNGVGVTVRNGRLDIALSIFKKKVKNSKILLEYKQRMEFQKPSDKKRKERSISKLRSKKYSNNLKY